MRAVTRVRWLQFAVSVTALWAYTLAVGANLPAVRASLMFTIAMLGYVLYRSSSLLNTLGVSALVLLVWRPEDVFDASFHLTFVSVGAIVGLAIPLLDKLIQIGEWTPSSATPLPPHVRPWLRRMCETIYWVPDKWAYESSTNIWSGTIVKRPYFNGRLGGIPQKAARYLIESVVVSAIAQAAMLPLSIIYFNRVTVSSVVLNIWVSIFMTLQAAAAVGGVVLSLIADILGEPLFAVAGWVNFLMLALPRAMSELGLTGWRLPAYTGGGTVVYVVFLAMLACLAALTIQWEPFERRSKQTQRRLFKMLISGVAIVAMIMVTHPFIRPATNGELRVSFLDVGQGDAVLIELPKGGTVLVDGGGRRKYKTSDEDGSELEPDFRGIGEAVTNQVLWSRGISKIDIIAVTHADADHAQGLVDVAGAFPFKSLLMGRDACSNAEIERLCSIADGQGSSIEVLAAGSSFEMEGVTFDVLAPLSPDGVYDNDASLVLRLTYGGRSFLLTGDIERRGEAEVLGSGLSLAADVVKIPHHGSKTSSTPGFVAAVNARYAVVSAGRRSQFGHPHADVISRWIAAGAAVLSTQDNGMITFTTDGESIGVETFVRW
jgi:competence protein ComEC